ncbi:hypothetical protein GCM10025868_03020 [Angustibacter aerolatus]|uniref:Branched-chain amino acid ABC transporter permease n=1 Tax=Angustibacter aerolatus TaxID=1162965 RepID=A0ABQ6JDR7_9ACTN|nr:hypothetical protein GCM10025868_03020 [Angustibacter aerolatus]
MSTSTTAKSPANDGGRTQPGRRNPFARLADLPRPVKILLMVALAVLLYALPLLDPPYLSPSESDFGGVLFNVAAYVLVALGLNVVLGYAGLLDLGYVGFYAIGAYTVGILGSLHGKIPFLVLLPLAALLATVSGILLGAPTLRVRGDYLAIVTLGFGEIIRLILLNSTNFTGGAPGISSIPKPPSHEFFGIPHLVWQGATASVDLGTKTSVLTFGILDYIPYYWLALTVIILILFADKALQNSRVGRAWEATREDEDAAELMGVPTFRFACWRSPSAPSSAACPGRCSPPDRGSSTPTRSPRSCRSCSSPPSWWAAPATAGASSSAPSWCRTCPSCSARSPTTAC